MKPFSIKCHAPGTVTSESCFFILSRGINAGRPAYIPNANCFRLSCAPGDLDTYYWLMYTLWETGYFHQFLKGSCVLFVRIEDVKNAIDDNIYQLDRIIKSLETLRKLRELEMKLNEQIYQIRLCRRSIQFRPGKPGSALYAAPSQAQNGGRI